MRLISATEIGRLLQPIWWMLSRYGIHVWNGRRHIHLKFLFLEIDFFIPREQLFENIMYIGRILSMNYTSNSVNIH